jgi:hypothetical protein
MHHPFSVAEIKGMMEHLSLFCTIILVIFEVTAVNNLAPSSEQQNMTSDGMSAPSQSICPEGNTPTGGNMTTSGFGDSEDDGGGGILEDIFGGGGAVASIVLFPTASATSYEEDISSNCIGLIVTVDVVGASTAQASDFIIEVSSFTSDTSIELDPNPFTFPGNEAGTWFTYVLYDMPFYEINYYVNVIQEPNGDYSTDYVGCTGTWEIGEYKQCTIMINYETLVPDYADPGPISNPESVPEYLLPPNILPTISNMSPVPLLADMYPLLLVTGIVVLGGIGLGKYNRNRRNGRRIKIPPSEVVDITTKGGRGE